jgi:hypothetical protein
MKGLLGKKVGDVAKLPNGMLQFEKFLVTKKKK